MQTRLLFICLLGLVAAPAMGASLPYEKRVKGYSAFGTTVSGDIRTLGEGGATVAIPSGLSSSFENPANIAIALGGTGIKASGNTATDANIQDRSDALFTYQVLGGGDLYPWGFSFGSRVPWNEGTLYTSKNTTEEITPSILSREYYGSISRVMSDRGLTLGMGIKVGEAVEKLELMDQKRDFEARDYTVGATAGVLMQLPRRWLVGVSISTPMVYDFSSKSKKTEVVEGFFRPMIAPSVTSFGIGWVPNRFFHVGASFLVFGTQEGTSLIRDERHTIGTQLTAQPRIGTYYKFMEYKWVSGTLGLGSYFEMARVMGAPHRFHFTSGLEISPWVLEFGWGLDVAPAYRNYIYSFGVDVIKVLTKLDLWPKLWSPPQLGLFPNPAHLSEEGLPRGMCENWEQKGPTVDIIDLSRQAPGKMVDTLEKVPGVIFDEVDEFRRDYIDEFREKYFEEFRKEYFDFGD